MSAKADLSGICFLFAQARAALHPDAKKETGNLPASLFRMLVPYANSALKLSTTLSAPSTATSIT